MDIVRFKGGLGNQMFQYSFYRSLESKNREVKANLGYYEDHPDKMPFVLTKVFPQIKLNIVPNHKFDIINTAWKEIKQDRLKLDKFLTNYEERFFWVEGDDFYYCPEVYETKNCTFVGYWQTEKYFSDIRTTLLKDFNFSYGEQKLQELSNKFHNSKQYVSVHIRRGDYLKNPESWGNLSESSYYCRAVSYIKKRVSNPEFVFFSDDIEWVKKNYAFKNAIYIENQMFQSYESWYDMCLMSCCSHNIIANSTFSWWGAWLNQNKNKIVIIPQKWIVDGRSDKDIYPYEWVKI